MQQPRDVANAPVRQQACANGSKCLHAEPMRTKQGMRKRGRRRTSKYIERYKHEGIDLCCQNCKRYCCSMECLQAHEDDPSRDCRYYVSSTTKKKRKRQQEKNRSAKNDIVRAERTIYPAPTYVFSAWHFEYC